ncbi:N-acylsphingosine amidohydrolase (acid ceramidase) [Halocaridina rubra]|uniref:Acid ceramidase n=1 Tax=Halocaridina rubra TaxID=373956 RepID=A0AAN8ZVS1_HALRR
MKIISCLFVLVLSISAYTVPLQQNVQTCERSAYPPDDKDAVSTYIVNLDLSPLQRWAPLMKEKGPMLHALVEDVKDLLLSVVGEKIFKFLMNCLDKLGTTLPYPYYEEVVGIGAYSNLPTSTVVLYNIFYEAFTLCTSIVAQDPNGHVYHARTLDTGLFLGWDRKNKTWKVAELLHPLTVQLNFTKNGVTIFQSTSFAGYVGVLTGVRKDKFSLSVDKRFSLNGGMVGLLEWILFNDHNQSWVSFLTREVMQEANDYNVAKELLSETRLLAPVYFILAGTKAGEGSVITRDRSNANVLELGSNKNGSGSWYLVQTNYDHWKTPPFFDDRRTPANRCMMEGGQKNVSFNLLYNVLSTKPVLNKESIYTSLMSAKTGKLHSWLRYCPDPCWPW